MPNLDEIVAGAAVNRGAPDWRQRMPKPARATFAPGAPVRARMETNRGPMVFRLLTDTAPMHVTSFAYLARLGFFDGLAFHRVITGFMAQGGCPKGDGTGGPGYRMDGEYDPKVRHDRPGLLSAANAGPGTDGSQFFVTFTATPWLDGKHTIFGELVEGADVLKQLEAAGSESGRPKEPLRIERVTVEQAA
jgi:cyclophilin family peptidyl-prolyl cis-trans isomerase